MPWSYENKDFKAFIVAKDKAYNSNTTPLLFKRKTHRLREKDTDLSALKDKIAKQEKFQNHTEQTLLERFSNATKDLEKIHKIALEQGDFYKDFLIFKR